MAQPVFIEESPADALAAQDNRPWYRQLNRYHWFVFVVAALGWLFDCFDQQIFTLTPPAARPRSGAQTQMLPNKTRERARRAQLNGRNEMFGHIEIDLRKWGP